MNERDVIGVHVTTSRSVTQQIFVHARINLLDITKIMKKYTGVLCKSVTI